MSLLDQINQDINSSLKAGNRDVVSVLRMLKNTLETSQKSMMHELDNQEEQKILRKEIKKRIEARDLYISYGEPLRAKKESQEAETLSKYASKQLGEEELDKIISTVLANKGSDTSYGVLMSEIMAQVSGRADGGLVSKLLTTKIKGE